ncbi:hypothetical protein [Streptomyces sp. NPDC002851]
MNLEELRHGNFSSLGEVIKDWSSVVKKLKEMEKTARDDLKAKADRADWSGVNASVSREFISKTAGEFHDAIAQATSIRNVLRDTRDELVEYQTQLKREIDSAWDKKITVLGIQGGGFKVFVSVHPEPSGSKEAVNSVRDNIQRILNKATESDSTAAEVLRAISDQAKLGFSAASYKDRDTAAEALKRAEQLAKKAKNPENLSPKELADFNRTLEKYRDDELFADRFATKLGAKETLEFWTEIAGAHQGKMDEVADLQKNLSMTLATATQSDSSAMQKWEREIVREGNTAFRQDPVRNPTGVYGFQVMSSLMSKGKYDTAFLSTYGDELLKRDKSHTSGASGTREIWGDSPAIDLNAGKSNGSDPIIGFMEALSHNPDASEGVFDSKSDLNHLLDSTKNTDRGQSVSRALEAAVTNVPHGGEPPANPVPHSKTQVDIVNNLMHSIAQPDGGAELVNKKTGESFGHIAAAYMPEINRTVAGHGAENIFTTNSQLPNGLDRTDTYRFLDALGRDDDARASVIYGRNIYSSSAIESHIANPDTFGGSTKDAVEAIAHNSGIIEGILHRSDADVSIQEQVDADKSTNDAMKRQGDFFKTMLATGMAAGAVALAPQAAGAQLAVGAGGAYFSGVAGIAIDNLYDGRQVDNMDKVLYHNGRELNMTEDATTLTVIDAGLEARKEHDYTGMSEDTLSNTIRKAVHAGWVESDSRLEDVKKRPSE